MDSPSGSTESPEGVLVRNSFIRDRNVLIAWADLSPLFVDFYLHLKSFQISVTAEHARLFKEFLAGFTLHAASRPRNEVVAWTIHFQEPHVNLFLTADTELSHVAGRIFTEGLADEPSNMFYQEQAIRNKPLHRSIVPFEGTDPKGTIEYYYSQSEQRPGRFYHLGEDRYALLTAHPDWDAPWFRNLDPETVKGLDRTETLVPIENRQYNWYCGCHYTKILDILSNPMQTDPEGLFGDRETIQVNCPRCAARYRISREAMEAHLQEKTR